jgi:hypothetical protein
LAAEYIAAQFRRAGLEPPGDDGYFQTAWLTTVEPNSEDLEVTVSAGGRSLRIGANEISLANPSDVRLEDVPLFFAGESTRLAPEDVRGKAVLFTARAGGPPRAAWEPALELRMVRRLRSGPFVIPPESPGRSFPSGEVAKPELSAFLAGTTDARITVHAAASRYQRAKVRNVAGVLRGSDRELRDSYVMLTSHYDHVGLADSGEDRIFNGANDDASGTSSVIEVASALAALPVHPKRSVLFTLFFGEEHGLWGSAYYAAHPLVPPAQTIADLNLEQVGRTDAADGEQIKTASVTGYDFSDLPAMLAEAGRLAGVRVYKNAKVSDAYFGRSDNLNLAALGIPAHTLCVAFDFPDYHKVSDSWEKLDYVNMAAVDRAVALGVMRLASEAPPPAWNEAYRPAQRYVDAAKKLRAVSH